MYQINLGALMGKANFDTNLVKEAFAYLKRGKKSLLQSSPVKSFNKEGMRYLSELSDDVIQISRHAKQFLPLETLEKAKQYAEKDLGIKDFDISNLDLANYTLQGLHHIKQLVNTELGLTRVVSKDVIRHPITGKLNSNIAGSMDINNGILTLSEKSIRQDFVNKLSIAGIKDPKNMMNYLKMLQGAQSGELKLIEIIKQLKTLGYNPKMVQELPNQTLFHEIFHRLHFLNCLNAGLDYNKMGKFEELLAWGVKDKSMLEEFLSEKVQKIISSWKFIGDYAKASPCEFVAEVGSAIANGIKPPKEIMDLYYKYGGPKIRVEYLLQ